MLSLETRANDLATRIIVALQARQKGDLVTVYERIEGWVLAELKAATNGD